MSEEKVVPLEKPVGECTRSGYQTFAVIEQTENYYIVKNEKGEPLALDKEKCRVEIVGTSMIR